MISTEGQRHGKHVYFFINLPTLSITIFPPVALVSAAICFGSSASALGIQIKSAHDSMALRVRIQAECHIPQRQYRKCIQQSSCRYWWLWVGVRLWRTEPRFGCGWRNRSPAWRMSQGAGKGEKGRFKLESQQYERTKSNKISLEAEKRSDRMEVDDGRDGGEKRA